MQTDVLRELETVALAVFALYLAVAGAWDLKTRRVPNFLTLPGIGVVLIWRTIRLVWMAHAGLPVLPELAFVPYWAGVWMLWTGRMMGGGDAKLLMILFGVFPTLQFLFLLLAVTGLTMALVLLWRYGRRRRIGLFISSLLFRLVHRRWFPTEAELSSEGEPTAFLFAGAGMIMIVLSLV